MTEKELLELSVKASLEAGKAIMEIYRMDDFQVQQKEDTSPLTLADRRSDEIIRRLLETSGIPLISEESLIRPAAERKRWSRCWMVDPLDGTKEFISRNGEFTVNIALIEKGYPVLGVIFTPVTGELFFGNRETGSFRIVVPNGSAANDPALFIASAEKLPLNRSVPSPYTVVASRSHRNPETDLFIGELEKRYSPIHLISRGSSLKMCMVAEGRADIYPRLGPTMEWDTAAGHAIAKFAGCEVINAETLQELKYNKTTLTNPSFIVRRTHEHT
jgi:3'(2'), 5'-bisphosphate nucleotidase